MKKIFKYVIISTIIIILVGCSNNTSTSTSTNTVQAPQVQESENANSDSNNTVSSGSNTESNAVTVSESSVSSDKIEIIKEYTIKTSQYSSYTHHLIIVKNNNDVPCSIKSNSKAYDSEGNLIGADGGDINVLAPGYTSVIDESFEDIDGVASYEISIAVKEATYYKEIDSILEMQLDATSSKVFVTLTNNGDYPAQFVKAYVIFLDSEGNAVDLEDHYMKLTDSEIKPGESVTEEFKTRETFANAEVYFEGRASK